MANEFEILIKFGLSKEKANEALRELEKLKTTTTEVGKEAVKQEAEVTKATEKTFTSKKQLKDMVKQLGHEFPLLGAAGRLALNPIVAVTAGITAAWQIWKYRNDELAKSFGGLQLPDVSEDYIARIDRFADKLKKVSDFSGSAATKLKEVQATIDANAAFWQALGVDVGTGPAQAKAAAASTAAAQLLASGQAKSAAGVAVSAADMAKAKEMAAAAEADNQMRRGRLGEIDKMQDLAAWDPRRLYYDNLFRARYGYNKTADDARGIERGAMQSNSTTIGFYDNLQNRASLRASGQAEIGQAQDILGANVGARRDIANQTASQFAAAVNAVDPSNLATIGPKFSQMFAAMNDLLKRIEEANKELARKQSAGNQRP
jgi:hypothetical protein